MFFFFVLLFHFSNEKYMRSVEVVCCHSCFSLDFWGPWYFHWPLNFPSAPHSSLKFCAEASRPFSCRRAQHWSFWGYCRRSCPVLCSWHKTSTKTSDEQRRQQRSRDSLLLSFGCLALSLSRAHGNSSFMWVKTETLTYTFTGRYLQHQESSTGYNAAGYPDASHDSAIVT